MPITAQDRLLLHSLTATDHAGANLDDAALLQLLRLCQEGEKWAGQRVLAAMAFPLASMARRCHQSELAHFVSAAWFVIEGFNRERSEEVMTNLLLDTLKQVTRDRVQRWDRRILPLIGEPPQPEEEDSLNASELIAAAQRLELIDEQTTRILQSVYLRGLSGQETAQLVGSSHDMVRYRCSSARKVLRANQRVLVEHA